MMIMLEKKFVDPKPGSSDGSGSSSTEEPFQIYGKNGKKIDISRIPRIFLADGAYLFPADDTELLDMCPRPRMNWSCVGNSRPSDIYFVDVNADSCTVEECLELLKRIGCDNRFITNSVESARLFFAELNEDEAVKLRGLKEICSAIACSDLLFDM